MHQHDGELVRGASTDGSAQAAVDSTGRLVDLTLRWDLLRRPVWAVTEAVVSAVNAAQDAARARCAAGIQPPPPVMAWFETVSAEATMAMDRSTDALYTSIDDLTRYLEERRP